MMTAEQAGRAWARRQLYGRAGRLHRLACGCWAGSCRCWTFGGGGDAGAALGRYGACAVEEREDGAWIVAEAARFYHYSEPIDDKRGTFREILVGGAFDEALAAPALDVAITVGHDPDRTLARYRGPSIRATSRVWADDDALRFEFRVPDTVEGQRVLRQVRTGELAATSFTFVPGDERWKETRAGLTRQIMTVSKLVDVSLVGEGAYTLGPVAA